MPYNIPKKIKSAKFRIIAVITLYRRIFDFLEFQKFEKTDTFPTISRRWYINN